MGNLRQKYTDEEWDKLEEELAKEKFFDDKICVEDTKSRDFIFPPTSSIVLGANLNCDTPHTIMIGYGDDNLQIRKGEGLFWKGEKQEGVSEELATKMYELFKETFDRIYTTPAPIANVPDDFNVKDFIEQWRQNVSQTPTFENE